MFGPAPFVEMQLEQFEHYRAEFQPRSTDNLVPGAERWVGRYGEWIAAWNIEDGEYQGEWAMEWRCAVLTKADRPPFAWVPSGDLVFFDEHGRFGSYWVRPLPQRRS
jgi:hypothetical protein